MPGHENTDSVSTAPASRIATCKPINVTTGIMAFFSEWLYTTTRSRMPRARAAVM